MTATRPGDGVGRWRAGAVLAGFALLTLPLMPVQALLLKTSLKAARRFPNWYHRRVCRLLGIRLEVEGEVLRDRPVLVVANHSSWLDIPVLSAVAPVSFIAKKEVGGWPFVSSLARLQRSVFVDRNRRMAVAGTTSEMAGRLAAGDALVLFAEGTSTDGNRVLPLRSSLFGAVLTSGSKGDAVPHGAVVQTCAVVYSRLHGLPIGRDGRPFVGWYGDMELGSHAWRLLKSGPLDVRIRIGPPIEIAAFPDRKALTSMMESELRQSVARLLRDRGPDEVLEVTASRAGSRTHTPARRVDAKRWT